MAQAYLHNKQYPEGIEAAKKYVELSSGSGWAKLELAYAYAVAGNKVESDRIVNEVTSQPEPFSPYDMATICAAWRDMDGAFQWLEKAIEQRSVDIIWMRVDPRLDPVRSEPRFAAVLARLAPRRPSSQDAKIKLALTWSESCNRTSHYAILYLPKPERSHELNADRERCSIPIRSSPRFSPPHCRRLLAVIRTAIDCVDSYLEPTGRGTGEFGDTQVPNWPHAQMHGVRRPGPDQVHEKAPEAFGRRLKAHRRRVTSVSGA